MPTYYARATGNVNAAIWATTPTGAASNLFSSFTNADTLMSNNFTVTLNVNVTVLEIRNDNTGGATAGGGFTPNDGVTLNANVYVGATTSCIATSGTVSLTINGNVFGQTLTNGTPAIYHGSTGTLTINGSLTGSNVSGAFPPGAPLHLLAGSAVITGNVTGGTVSNQSAIYAANATTLTITGTVTGGSNTTAAGVDHRGSGTVLITGNIFGGSVGPGMVFNNSSATGTVNGNLTGGSSGTANAINWASSGALVVNGTVTGGTNSSASGLAVNGTGPATVNGAAIGSAASGAALWANATLTVTRAIGGPLANSGPGVQATGGSGVATVREIEYGDLGASPTSGVIRLTDSTANVALVYRFGTTKKTLVDTASTNLIPASSNVRSGTVYNAGQTTGTCAIPPAGSVVLGVPVDNTVGTAAISSAAVQSACDSALTAFSSGRLGNVATVASTGQQIADAFGQ